jgi:cell division protein FtsB
MELVSYALLIASASYLGYMLFKGKKLIESLSQQNRELVELATDQLHTLEQANMLIEELSNQQEIPS